MNKAALRAKKFVSDHKVAIAVTATTVVCYAFHRSTVKVWNNFLAEHNLTDVYYSPED